MVGAIIYNSAVLLLVWAAFLCGSIQTFHFRPPDITVPGEYSILYYQKPDGYEMDIVDIREHKLLFTHYVRWQ